MGKMAARTGDTAMTCNDPSDMPVGKVISTTATVLINKLPAAKQNDQILGTDIHIILIPSPGGPVPTPLPHPFVGMINSGCSTSVNIMGMPAATVDSEASNMPPHIPQGGPFQKPPTNKAKIIIGSANVFIGGGSGGGGGGGGGGNASEGKTDSTTAEVEEKHFVDVKFEDKGGKPITGGTYKIKTPDKREYEGPLTGQIRQSVAKEGNSEIKLAAITSAKWSKKEIETGKSVKIQIECPGFDNGADASIGIFIRDSGHPDHLLKVIHEEVSGEKVETDWTFEVDEDYLKIQRMKGKKYSTPAFFFRVKIGQASAQSDILKLKDWVELEMKDKEGNALKGKKYRATLSNGEVREGTLNNSGRAKLEKVPPGYMKVQIVNEKEDDDKDSDTQTDSR